MKKLSLILFILIMCLSICACGENKEEMHELDESHETFEASSESLLVGKWELVSGGSSNRRMTLYEDGTCMIEDEAGTWKVYGSELRVLGGFGGQFWDHDNFAYEYRLKDTLRNENELLEIDLGNGHTWVYRRVY